MESNKAEVSLIYENVSKAIQFIPLISIAAILLAFFSIYTQYLFYGIDITSYIEPSEILFSFSSIFFCLVYYLFFGAVFLISDLAKLIQPKEGETNFRRFMRKGTPLMLTVSVFGVLLMSILILNNPIISKDLTSMMYFAFLVFALSRLKLSQTSKIIIILSVTLFAIFNRNLRNHSDIVNTGIATDEVEFKCDGALIYTSDTFLFIGSVRNYIFFWDAPTKKVIVYPRQSINWISIKRPKIKGG